MPRKDYRNFPLVSTPPTVLPAKARKSPKKKATDAVKRDTEWAKYVDDNGFAFLPTNPKGKGAFNL